MRICLFCLTLCVFPAQIYAQSQTIIDINKHYDHYEKSKKNNTPQPSYVMSKWGAIAYDFRNRNFGVSWAASSRSAALKAARKSCIQAVGTSSACNDRHFAFTKCGSLYGNNTGHSGYIIGGFSAAEQGALRRCKRDHGYGCKRIVTICADSSKTKLVKGPEGEGYTN